MLHAVIKKKRKASSLREDDITSAFLGSLQLLPDSCQVKALAICFRQWMEQLEPIRVDLSAFERVEIELWPNVAETGRCEPDALLTFMGGKQERFRVLFEAKWGSPQSRRNEKGEETQLREQWERFDGKQKNAVHFYVTKKPRDPGNIDHRSRLASFTWGQLSARFADQSFKEPPEMLRWAELMRQFFETHGFHAFEGFRRPEFSSIRSTQFMVAKK